jgi:hypothetical protein
MTDHHHGSHHHHGDAPASKPFHKDWRLWLAVILMLIGMGAYIVSLDESNPPGGPPQQPMPAAP